MEFNFSDIKHIIRDNRLRTDLCSVFKDMLKISICHENANLSQRRTQNL